ncbi:hypothetical protein Q7375_15935 [Lactiplantibacillus plantarum]|nr:hypothetical protein [Lactiplantibacillus plantarum]MDO7796917.1 hypothetical protein [Lactiplantibacillus plantarum]
MANNGDPNPKIKATTTESGTNILITALIRLFEDVRPFSIKRSECIDSSDIEIAEKITEHKDVITPVAIK